MKQNVQTREVNSIDSHFSFGTNSINFGILTALAERSLAVKDDPSFPKLQLYYNTITETFELFMSLLPPDLIQDFELKSSEFQNLMIAVQDGQVPLTLRTVAKALFMLKNMRFIVIGYMQNNFKYFYRVSSRQPKGLKNLDYLLDNNIFKWGSHKDVQPKRVQRLDED